MQLLGARLLSLWHVTILRSVGIPSSAIVALLLVVRLERSASTWLGAPVGGVLYEARNAIHLRLTQRRVGTRKVGL